MRFQPGRLGGLGRRVVHDHLVGGGDLVAEDRSLFGGELLVGHRPAVTVAAVALVRVPGLLAPRGAVGLDDDVGMTLDVRAGGLPPRLGKLSSAVPVPCRHIRATVMVRRERAA